MRQIILINSNLNDIGGTERCCLDLIYTFKRLGYRVTLATSVQPNWNEVRRLLGEPCVRPDRTIYLSPWWLPAKGYYGRLLICQLIKHFKNHLTFYNTSTVSFGPNICYNHGVFPPETYKIKKRWFRQHLFHFPTLNYNEVMKPNDGTRHLCCSRWAADRLKKWWHAPSEVVYTAVNMEVWSRVARLYTRKNWCVTVTRLAPTKNAHRIFAFADALPQVKFIVICFTPVYNCKYAKWFFREAASHPNIHIFHKISAVERYKLIGKSKLLLWMGKGEHGGVALQECIAGGLFPIIIPEGGSLELVRDLPYGCAITNEEWIEAITHSLDRYRVSHALASSEEAGERWGLSSFKKEIMEILPI